MRALLVPGVRACAMLERRWEWWSHLSPSLLQWPFQRLQGRSVAADCWGDDDTAQCDEMKWMATPSCSDWSCYCPDLAIIR